MALETVTRGTIKAGWGRKTDSIGSVRSAADGIGAMSIREAAAAARAAPLPGRSAHESRGQPPALLLHTLSIDHLVLPLCLILWGTSTELQSRNRVCCPSEQHALWMNAQMNDVQVRRGSRRHRRSTWTCKLGMPVLSCGAEPKNRSRR